MRSGSCAHTPGSRPRPHHKLHDAVDEVDLARRGVERVAVNVSARGEILDGNGRDGVQVDDVAQLRVVDRRIQLLVRAVKLVDEVEHARLVEGNAGGVGGHKARRHKRQLLELRVGPDEVHAAVAVPRDQLHIAQELAEEDLRNDARNDAAREGEGSRCREVGAATATARLTS